MLSSKRLKSFELDVSEFNLQTERKRLSDGSLNVY